MFSFSDKKKQLTSSRGTKVNISSSNKKIRCIKTDEKIINELTIKGTEGKTERIEILTGYSSFYSESEQDQTSTKQLGETLQEVEKIGYKNLKRSI